MHFVVKSFRKTFAEGRFTPLLVTVGVLFMRFALFSSVELPSILSHEDLSYCLAFFPDKPKIQPPPFTLEYAFHNTAVFDEPSSLFSGDVG